MTTYYKVLVGDRSCHGGDMAWSLPTQQSDGSWASGEWHEHSGDLHLCAAGLHLTSDPAAWYVVGCEIYEAEADRLGAADTNKIVVGRCRLLRRLSDQDLAALRIYRSGSHRIGEGKAVAHDSASVVAHDEVTITVFRGSPQIGLNGNAVLIDRRGSRPIVRIAHEVPA